MSFEAQSLCSQAFGLFLECIDSIVDITGAGFPRIRELEAKYLPADELRKYDESVGL